MNICPICCNTDIINLIMDLQQCVTCTHIFKQNPVPKSVYENYYSSAHAEVSTKHVENAKLAARIRKDFIYGFKQSGSLLEIGSGHKFFLQGMDNGQWKLEGTELSMAMIPEIPYTMHFGNPSEIQELGVYDVIAGFHVLEHLNDPVKEMRILVEHLKDDGIIILEFPNINFYGIELNVNNFYEGYHTQYFNQLSLITFIQRCNLFPIKQINFWDGNSCTTLLCLVKDTKSTIDTYKAKCIETLDVNIK